MLYLSIQKLKKVEHLPPDLNVVPIYSQELEIVPLNLIVQLDESCFDNISSVRLDAGLIYTGSGHFEGQSIFGCKGMLMETKNDNAVEICFSSSMKISNCLGISIDALNTDNFHSAYLPALEIANLIEISPLLLSKITGTVIAKPGNANIGLELKLRKQELLVPELVRMNFDPTSGAERWEYSVEVVKLLRSYKDMFPEVFDVVSADATALTFDFLSYFRWKEGYSSVGLRMDAGRFLTSVCSWLKEQSIFNHNLVSLRTQVLDAKTIELLDKSLQVTTLMHRFVCSKTEILVPSLSGHEIQLDSELAGYSDVQLGDRVHYAFGDAGVPFGLGGFIIGIHRDEIPEELYYSRENSSIRKNLLVEVMFDEPLISGSSLNGKCKSNRGIRLHLSSLINLSYRMRNSPQQPQILQLVCLKLPSSINPAEYVPRMLDSMPFPYS
jgi:5'-3' exoribonuclease 1